ncbi:hypothetical protein RHGRI_028830 [Rhododendron griersonianum]|uniref:C2H2-type domain-containing protein n=1 Tax=Rhododendron griersonianum TaxID=479676 RepID=A0AAV6IH71_9ERIC|nr:hypothetical protein RHGRI_028830 [Rhododendron griersonianum]
MVSRNVLLDMLLSDSSSDDNSAVFIMFAFLYRRRLNRRKREEERLDRRKRSRIRRLRRQSRSLPRPFCMHMYIFLGRSAIDRVLKHGGGNDASDSCSSSSDPELQANNDDVVFVGEYDESLSYSSGYEGEDSSVDEVDVNSSGSLTKDDDIGIKDDGQGDANVVNTLSNTVAEENCIPSNVGCILKCKLGFKCRLCPRIVCMTEETLKAHLKSKRHARSETLLNKGRLRLIRNSDGKVEGEVNAGAERRARIAAAALVPANSKKEKEVRHKRRNRLKMVKGEDANLDKASLSAKHPA